MIMAEKIALLRKQNGWSQEELAEKLAVSRQSVSKWESGGSIPDLERVVRLAELFGVSTDYLVKDSEQEVAYTDAPLPAGQSGRGRAVSVEEADAYMETVRRSGREIALGVLLAILSPVCLLLLYALSQRQPPVLTERLAEGLGAAALFLLIAAAVALFVVNGLRLNRYDYLETEKLELAYGVYGIAQSRREAHAPRYRQGIALGVCGIILGLVPLMVAGALGLSEAADIFWTAFMLVCVAVSVYGIVRVSTVQESFNKLMEEGDYTPEKKVVRRRTAAVPNIYWSAATALYLALSFITGRWDWSWIVWPVAGALYPAVLGIVRSVVRGSLEEE